MKLACVGLLPLITLLQACVGSQLDSASEAREPVRWILVERRYGELSKPADQSDEQVNPEATVLSFQPLYAEDFTWEVVVSPEEHYVELIGFSPLGAVSPGEVVSATVRVGRAKFGERYRLLARPSQPGVRIYGPHEATVTGDTSTVFRFTSVIGGKAGIAVGVERIGSEVPP